MSSNFITLTGKANWANHLFIPDEEYSTYQLQLVLDEESLVEFEKTGSRLKTYEKEGDISINPKRKSNFGAPRVVDADGSPWDETVAIGNGSSVSVILEVYPSKRGKGTRLEAVRVDKHVVFDPDNFDPTQSGRDALKNGEVPF